MKLSTAVLARMAETSGLYQMFSELSDLIVITPKGSRYFQEVPHRETTPAFTAPHLANFLMMARTYTPPSVRLDSYIPRELYIDSTHIATMIKRFMVCNVHF
jgi:hypothetical protein